MPRWKRRLYIWGIWLIDRALDFIEWVDPPGDPQRGRGFPPPLPEPGRVDDRSQAPV